MSYLLFIKMSLEGRLEGLSRGRWTISGKKLIDQGSGHGSREEHMSSALLRRWTVKGCKVGSGR